MQNVQIFKILCIITLMFPSNFTYKQNHSVKSSESFNTSITVVEEFRANIDGENIVFRIVNGEPAKLGEVPYQIAILQQLNPTLYDAFCGGSIIGPKKILTAAHCVEIKKTSDCYKGELKSSDLRKYRVAAGQLWSRARENGQGQWRKIKKGKYPRYYQFPAHDIAILHLDEDFVYNEHVQPIGYATVQKDYKLECLVAGYGRLSNKFVTDRLMKAKLKLLSMKSCNKVHHEDFSKFICTSDKTSDIHKGDSGAPLVCQGTGDPAEKQWPKGIVVGVLAGKAFNKLMSAFFTRVSSYVAFVNSSLKLSISSYTLQLFLSFRLLLFLFKHYTESAYVLKLFYFSIVLLLII